MQLKDELDLTNPKEPWMARDEITLRAAVELGAWALALACSAVLLLALVAELIRRRNAHSVVVVLADRLLPTAGHRAAVALLAVMAGIVGMLGTQTASADNSVRHWLEAPAAHPEAPANSDGASDDEPAPPSPPTTPSPTNAPPTNAPPPSAPEVAPPSPRSDALPPAPDWEVPPSRAATVVRPAETPRTGHQEPSPRAAKPIPEFVPTEPRVPAPAPTRGPAPPPAAPTVGLPVGAPAPAAPYFVEAGDCLWSIAQRALGSSATNADIDRGWRTVYDANRAAIGDDPNLIHPGLMLNLPSLTVTPKVTP